MNSCRVKLLGKYWQVSFVSNLGKTSEGEKVLGKCDDPSTPNKAIRVLQSLRGEVLLDTLIHEAMHAINWQTDEDIVHEAATDLARLLYRVGFRMEGEDG